ncbi:Protein phosphatase 1 regulatory subunit 3D [Trametes pubescens]|uniref:Protein phosphatase 1 regulatory subunit 3D n=1 Tax=Trametes pubescens TaxID=154538 RepID=A0A1M2VFB1_TRAPU|nr:Protein phosphatase 1 regulatory subunit 3D [Trametes pubescens]
MSTVVNIRTYSTPMDYSLSRHTNSAGAPLPRIPRRASASRTHTASSSTAAAIHSIFAVAAPLYSPPATPAALVVQPPTPERVESPTRRSGSEEGSSSSSSSEAYVQMLNPRANRVRRPKMQSLRAPADSTPTPAVHKAKNASERAVAFPVCDTDENAPGNETPRPSTSSSRLGFRIDLGTLKTPLGESSTAIRSDSSNSRAVSAPQESAANLARKKSGEPLKSSLKSRRPIVRGDLSVVTDIASTKSEPATPMGSKSVHFDAKLEHVKLFLAEQKPLAISRQGSPTDTSGTESDFPSAIYGHKRTEDKMLTMQVANMPASPRLDADIAFERLELASEGTVLNGTVRVRNLAFEKWVAVRFTVDSWQTTSEVTARYADSIEAGVFDRFSFSIRLGDMLARIEEKTMFFALRYNVAGREIWDNNDGQNYKVTFAKVPRISTSTSADSGLASLKSKLENVVKGRETVGGYVAEGRKTRAESFTLEATTSLSARYDFAQSLKSPWTRTPIATKSPAATKSVTHARTSTYPNSIPQFPIRAGVKKVFEDVPSLTRGSPRILDSDDTPTLPLPVDGALEDTPVAAMSRRGGRNHQRGYFDLGLSHHSSGCVRRTPTSVPADALSPMSVPRSVTTPEQAAWYVEMGGSEESTPSVTTSESSSPSGSPVDDAPYNVLGANVGGLRSPVESDSYSVFLNRYCYYTGGGAGDPFLDAQPEAIHRSHSASSVEEFLSGPNPNYMLSPGEAPTRSPSYDDVVSMSGNTTPTARSMGMFGHAMASPSMLSVAQ